MARRGENIRKRNDGRWEGRFVVRTENTASYRSVYAKSYGEVKKKLALAKVSVDAKPLVNLGGVSQIKIDELASEWMTLVQRTRKRSTYDKYRSVYVKHIKPMIGNMLITDLKKDSLQQILQNAQSESVQRSIYCIIKQLLELAEHNYQIVCMKPEKYARSGKAHTVTIMNHSEQMKLINYLYEDMDIFKLGILMCLSMGLRLGEICALKWDDVDMDLQILHVNRTVQRLKSDSTGCKTKLVEDKPKSIYSKREIPISTQLYELMKKYYCKGKYVLNNNKPMDPRTYQNKFKNYLRKAGIESKNFHVLRHTFATNCINSGADVKCVSEILGHSDVKITLNRYVHPDIDIKRTHLNSLSAIYGQLRGQIV